MNSAGAAGCRRAASGLRSSGASRTAISPAPRAGAATWKDAKADGRTLSGKYASSRRSDSGWFRIATFLLGQVKVTADKDGILTVSAYRGVNNQPKHWREVGPFQYQAVGGDSRLEAVVKDGKVQLIMKDDLPPVMALQPVSGAMSANWNLPLFI